MTISVLMQYCIVLSSNLILGPTVIPEWHKIYGKKCWRCGTYKRRLILHSGNVVEFIIQRFYCPETKLTYSLLPFFIERYERHTNSVIEEFLRDHLIHGQPIDELVDELPPSVWTIRRWTKRFCKRLKEYPKKLERYLTLVVPQFRAAASGDYSLAGRMKNVLDSAKLLCNDSYQLLLCGSISYANLAVTLQTRLDQLSGFAD
jgi:hypothetical protein